MSDNVVNFPNRQFDEAALACCPCNGEGEEVTPLIPVVQFVDGEAVIEAVMCPECDTLVGVTNGRLDQGSSVQ